MWHSTLGEKRFNQIMQRIIKMKIEYNNLYTHFIFTTLHRLPVIHEKHRDRIEKYMTGIINNNNSHLYSIYANPEHVHFLVSRSPKLSEESWLKELQKVPSVLLMKINFLTVNLHGRRQRLRFPYLNLMWIKFVNTFSIKRNITGKWLLVRSMKNL